MGDIRKDIQEASRLLGPERSTIAQTIASLRLEKRMLEEQVARLTKDHHDLYRIMVVVLDQLRDEGVDELRIHNTQFKRFNELYRIERSYDKEAEEVVLKLKYHTDT